MATEADLSQPLVSVVIPSYNYGQFVGDAVESALAQTYRPIEVIVVDDGSTDDTLLRLLPFSGRIRVIHQENRGLSAARNAGIKAASAEWVAFLDSDDLWHPEKLQVQMAGALKSGADLVGSSPTDELPEHLDPDPRLEKLTVRDFLSWTPLGPSSAIVRRSCFDTLGLFDESLRSVEDLDMWLRLAARFSVVRVDSPCWWYRTHTGQMTRNPDRMYENCTRVLRRFFAEHPEHRHLRRVGWAFLYWDSAIGYMLAGRRARSLAWLLTSAALWPWRIREGVARRGPRARLLVRLVLGDSLFFGLIRRMPGTRSPAAG